MKYICHLLPAIFLATVPGCEIHDEQTVSVKHKAAVYLKYHYDNGETATLRDIRSMRLFIYDNEGRLYRDTLLPLHTVLGDGPVMQTYLSRGRYTFVSWANISDSTVVRQPDLNRASLGLHTSGADNLLYGRFETPVVKGDSLRFDIDLFKSVFKINVLITGLEKTPHPESHYFGIYNREALDFFDRPSGDLKRYRPELTYDRGRLSGSFYTPYFTGDDDFTIGVYCDHPQSQYTRLCETTIRNFADIVDEAIGHDVEINVEITVRDTGVSITVSDWDGVIVQDEQLGH